MLAERLGGFTVEQLRSTMTIAERDLWLAHDALTAIEQEEQQAKERVRNAVKR